MNVESRRGTVDTASPWLDEQLAADERSDLLLARLDLDEKLAQVSCYYPADINQTEDLSERYPLGVGHVSSLEARSARTLDEVTEFQHGVQESVMRASRHRIPAIFHMEGLCGAFLPGAVSFPSGMARAASWDVELENQIGEIVGRQERALGITQTLAPVLDIGRDPRMGRHGETYGEDPTLASALGVAFTLGLQGRGPGNRRTESVAKHFFGSHHTAGGIHGAHCDIPDRLLVEVYGKPFQAAITAAGLRGVMPSYNSVSGMPMSSSPLLTTLLRGQMGFDGLVVSDYGAIGNMHYFQRTADTLAEAGLAALRAGMDVELHVPQAFGSQLRDWFDQGRADVSLLDRAAREVLRAKFRMGLFEDALAPSASVRDAIFHIPSDDEVTLQSARESLVLLRNDGVLPIPVDIPRVAVIGCHAVSARYFFGGYTHYSMAEGKLATNSSMAGLTTRTEDLNTPAQTLPGTTIEASERPEYEDLLKEHKPGIRTLLQELRERMPTAEMTWAYGYPFAGTDESGHEEAVTLAARADVVLLTLGGKHGTASIASMGEGIDATSINLPPCQENLIVKLAALNKPMVGVHLDGRPLSSDAADAHLDAIVEAWSPAEAGAQAIVDVLTGAYAPSGRLPVSVARNAGQVPVYYSHPAGSSWHQGDSIGFPDYVDAPHTPRYHFGHGLTYTTFEYSDLVLSRYEASAGDKVEVTLSLTNTGTRTGIEIVQLYVRDRFASVSRPVLELAGFRRVELEAGAGTTVRFSLDISQLAFLDADLHWRVEAGDVDIMAGSSSADLRLTASLRVTEDALVDGATRGFYAE